MGIFGKENKKGGLDKRYKKHHGVEGFLRDTGNQAVKGIVGGIGSALVGGMSGDSQAKAEKARESALKSYEAQEKAKAQRVVAEAEAERMRAETKMIENEAKKKQLEDQAAQPWLFDDLFKTQEGINSVILPDYFEELEKTIVKLLTIATNQTREVISSSSQMQQIKAMSAMRDGSKSTFGSRNIDVNALQKATNPYQSHLDYMDCAIAKAKEGIRKLRRTDDPSVPNRVADCTDMLDDLTELKPKVEEKNQSAAKSKTIQIVVLVVVFVIIATIVVLNL